MRPAEAFPESSAGRRPHEGRAVHAGPLAMLAFWLAAVLVWWALAFFRLPPTTPDWLVRARNVCFRTFENGLPDAAGWLMLVVPPAAMLGTLLVVWGSDVRSGLRRVASKRAGRWLLVAAGVVVVLEAAWVAARVREGLRASAAWTAPAARQAMPDDYPRADRPMPDFSLVDRRGRPFGAADLRGGTSLVTFAFAHCETVCPVVLRSLLDGAARIEPRPRVVVVTVDPWRDTPALAAGAAERWGLAPDDELLTGPVAAVTAALEGFGVPIQRNETDGTIAHPALVYVVDGEGTIAYALTNPAPAWVAEAVRRTREPSGEERRR